MLEIDHLRVQLGPRHWHFHYAAESDGIHAVLGESGSGKSTLLNLIAGFLSPGSGDLRWKGEKLLPVPPEKRPVTTLFQQHNLFPHLTTRQNVGLAVHPGLKLSPNDWTRVEGVLDDVGLADAMKKRPAQLSGGEQQRAGLARCLLRARPILLLDEPFSALDSETRQRMIELTRHLIERQSPCVFMVTHAPNDAAALGATVLRIEDGELAPWGVPS